MSEKMIFHYSLKNTFFLVNSEINYLFYVIGDFIFKSIFIAPKRLLVSFLFLIN